MFVLFGLTYLVELFGIKLYYGHALESVFAAFLLSSLFCIVAVIIALSLFKSNKFNSSTVKINERYY